MAAMVITVKRMLKAVFANATASAFSPWPISSPARTAATKMAVPVAVAQFRVNIAASAVGFATTGGTRRTKLCKPATGNFTVVMESIHWEN